MKIVVTFKHYPRSGKFIQCGRGQNKYYVTSEGKNRRLPKFLWERLQ